MSRFDDRHSDAVAGRNLTWEGDTTIVMNGLEYHCEMDCSVFLFKSADIDPYVGIESFECEIGGKPVHDMPLRRELRAKLCEWVENNRDLVIRKAR